MSGFAGMKRLLAGLSVVLLQLALAPVAKADPVVMFSGASGVAGSQVALRFSGDTNHFFGSDLQITFDDHFLTFIGTSSNVDAGTPNIMGGLAIVTLNPPIVGQNMGSGPSFDYFDLIFEIQASAMGSTVVGLLNGSTLYFATNLELPDGDVIAPVGGKTAMVNVLLPNAVPIGSTGPLALSALALLALARARASRPQRSATALAAG